MELRGRISVNQFFSTFKRQNMSDLLKKSFKKLKDVEFLFLIKTEKLAAKAVETRTSVLFCWNV